MFNKIVKEKINISYLENGIKWVHQKTNSGMCYMAVCLRSGSSHEVGFPEGIAHFGEHMFFKGTSSRSAIKIINDAEGIGAEINAFTSRDYMCIHMTFHENFIHHAIDLLTDILFHSAFPTTEIEKERKIILDELKYYKDLPEENIHDVFFKSMFKKHPLAHNIIGTKNSVASITRKDLRKFFKSKITASNLVISTLGNIPHHKMIPMLNKFNRELPRQESTTVNSATFKYKSFQKIQKTNDTQSYVVLGSDAPQRDNDSRIGYYFLNNILGGSGMNSKLNLALREKHALVYQVESSYQPFDNTGVFNTYFFCSPGNENRCIELCEKEIRSLISKPIKEEELNRYKIQFISQMLIGNESHLNLCISNGKAALQLERWKTQDQVIHEIKQMTPEHLQNLAAELLGREKSLLVFKGER